jgi:hypothetical protein
MGLLFAKQYINTMDNKKYIPVTYNGESYVLEKSLDLSNNLTLLFNNDELLVTYDSNDRVSVLQNNNRIKFVILYKYISSNVKDSVKCKWKPEYTSIDITRVLENNNSINDY